MSIKYKLYDDILLCLSFSKDYIIFNLSNFKEVSLRTTYIVKYT